MQKVLGLHMRRDVKNRLYPEIGLTLSHYKLLFCNQQLSDVNGLTLRSNKAKKPNIVRPLSSHLSENYHHQSKKSLDKGKIGC